MVSRRADRSSGSTAQLHLLAGELPAAVLPLATGRNTIGRSPSADLSLDHPTLSGLHCVIEIGQEAAVVQDLGSTNGTFLDAEPVQRAELRPGQTLRLGQIELRFEQAPADLGCTVAPAMLPETDAGQPRLACAHHAQNRASWICTECARPLCAACIQQVRLESPNPVSICRDCDGLCQPIGRGLATLDPTQFGRGLLAALFYPLRGNGLILLLAAAGLNAALALTGRWFLFAGMAWILGLGVGAYVLSYLREVILTSTEGAPELPGWPECDRERLGEAVLEFAGLSLLSFGPWMLCRVWLPPEAAMTHWVCYGLLGFGICYFPMALLAVVMHDNLSAANPILVAVSVFRSPLRYLVLCGFVGAMLGVVVLLETAVVKMAPAFVGSALATFASCYATMAALRAVGWFYFCNKEKLGWS